MPKVTITKCDSYDSPTIEDSLRLALEPFGGMANFVKRGESVLIKPNMLRAARPEEAVTTHPAVVKAIIALVRAAGGQPKVGDSPCLAFRGVKNVWEKTGIGMVCEETETEMVNFETSGAQLIARDGYELSIARPVLESDVVISAAKFKTHSLTVMTGAIKNLYGTIPGMKKSMLHRDFAKPKAFSEILADLLEIVKPRLTIMDGVLGMEGDGPSAGEPRHLGRVIAGEDLVAVDAVCAHMMGVPPMKVDTIRVCAERGLGIARLDEIEIVGASSEEAIPADFRVPRTTGLRFVPQPLLNACRSLIWIRPKFTDRCSKCGQCATGCPAEAICLGSDGPILDGKMCIECLCCHEQCPENAIDIEMSLLARAFVR